MIIRNYSIEDCKILLELFYNTVHEINKKDYSKNQLDIWAKPNIDSDFWNKSFLEHYTIVAEINGIIVGFGDIDGDYLDRLYVHKDHQRKSIGTKIVDSLEQHAQSKTHTKIITHSSITAKPFFENRGYIVKTIQQVNRENILLTNYVMEKVIN